MPIIDKIKRLKSRFPGEDIELITLACHLGNNLDLAKECKEKLEVCNDYRDIAQIVVKPLYINCEIDDVNVKKRAFITALLDLSTYGKQGKYKSAYYHIRKMLDEDEVKERRKRAMAKETDVQREKTETKTALQASRPKYRATFDITPEQEKAIKLYLAGSQAAGLIQNVSIEPIKNTRLMGNKVRFVIEGESNNLIQVVKRLGTYGISNPKHHVVSRIGMPRRCAPIQRRKFLRTVPSPDIVVQLPPEMMEPQVYHVLTGVQGIKLKLGKPTKGRARNPFGRKALPSAIIK